MKETYRCAACRVPFDSSSAASLHYVNNHYNAVKSQNIDQLFSKRPRSDDGKLQRPDAPPKQLINLPLLALPTPKPNIAVKGVPAPLPWRPTPVRRPRKSSLSPPPIIQAPSEPLRSVFSEAPVYKKLKTLEGVRTMKRRIHLRTAVPLVPSAPEPSQVDPLPSAHLPSPKKCFQCRTCSQPFSSIDEVALHMLQLHCDSTSECPYCKATSADFNGLRIHMEFSHREEAKAWGGFSKTQGCVWCQSKIRHLNYCMVKKVLRGVVREEAEAFS